MLNKDVLILWWLSMRVQIIVSLVSRDTHIFFIIFYVFKFSYIHRVEKLNRFRSLLLFVTVDIILPTIGNMKICNEFNDARCTYICKLTFEIDSDCKVKMRLLFLIIFYFLYYLLEILLRQEIVMVCYNYQHCLDDTETRSMRAKNDREKRFTCDLVSSKSICYIQ